MRYSVEYIGKNGERNNIVFVFDDPYSHVGVFLWAEVSSLERYVKYIDDVLDGKRDSDEVDGNAYCVYIKKYFSVIEDMLAEKDDESVRCTVDTMELKKIILAYIQKRKEFLKTKEDS